MSRFLFASTAVRAHSSNPLPIAARLIERGHRVDWYAGRAFHPPIAAVGARPHAFEDAVDFSTAQLWESFPALANKRGPRLVSHAYADIFVGQARARVSDLRRILRKNPADAMLCDGLMFGVDLVHELGGPPWATYGDTPLTLSDPDTPPFGAGLLPKPGRLGRLRNRVVAAAVSRLVYARPNHVYRAARADIGLPPMPDGSLPCLTSPYLHLQACTSSFEYPRANLPEHIHWIGALRPDASPDDAHDIPWWPELERAHRVVHVTQGSLRPDLRELIVPSLRALAKLDALVVVTTGGPDARAVAAAYGGALPRNVRVAPFVPYDRLLERADLFVTNGGYTGVMMALRHGVPIVQAGVTEEKAEIGARIAWSGVGLRLRTSRPSAAALRGAVQRVIADPSFARAAALMQRELREHDASVEAAARLEQLAATRLAVRRCHDRSRDAS